MLTLKQRLKIAYRTEYFPERKRVVDLLKLLTNQATTIFKTKEILQDGVSYEGWIGKDVSISLKCVIGEVPDLYLSGELLDTSDCIDLCLILATTIQEKKKEYYGRDMNMDGIIQKSINSILSTKTDT